jgi:hypothetical protein
MPAIKGYWRKGMKRADAPYLPLTPDVVDEHLRGDIHIGLYPLADDDSCWWVAADFDKEAAMLDALAYPQSRPLLPYPGGTRGFTIRPWSARMDILCSGHVGLGRASACHRPAR